MTSETGCVMSVSEALELIVNNWMCPALNYCIDYARYALSLGPCGPMTTSDRRIFKVQLLYVLCNMTHWRAGKSTTATAEQIKTARQVLKKASN